MGQRSCHIVLQLPLHLKLSYFCTISGEPACTCSQTTAFLKQSSAFSTLPPSRKKPRRALYGLRCAHKGTQATNSPSLPSIGGVCRSLPEAPWNQGPTRAGTEPELLSDGALRKAPDLPNSAPACPLFRIDFWQGKSTECLLSLSWSPKKPAEALQLEQHGKTRQ